MHDEMTIDDAINVANVGTLDRTARRGCSATMRQRLRLWRGQQGFKTPALPVSVSRRVLRRFGKWIAGRLDSAGELIASRCFADATLHGQRGQRLTDMSRAHAAGVAEFDQGQGTIGVGEDLLEFIERGGRQPRIPRYLARILVSF
jgi:hypothetical protein